LIRPYGGYNLMTSKNKPQYLIIGNGRVARHFLYYFSRLNFNVSQWSRTESLNSLTIKIAEASHILFLINDSAIESFISKHVQNTHHLRIHFSGSLITGQAYGVHPLMTFGEQLYSLEEYKNINFVIDNHCPDFKLLFPDLAN